MARTFTIPACNLASFKARIAALNKKAIKLMGEEVTYTVGSPFVKKVDEIGMLQFHEVVVAGPAPMLNGWKIELIIDHSNDMNIVTVLGSTPVGSWFDAAATCQHCSTNRRRNFTYLLKSSETAEFKQVGKSCLRDFTGHAHPESVAAWASVLREFDDEVKADEDVTESGAANYRMLATMPFLAKVCAVVLEDGGQYFSSKDVDTGTAQASTSTFALSYKGDLTSDHADMALLAVEYTLAQPATSDFMVNLQRLLRFEHFDLRYTGTVAYAVGGYVRHLAEVRSKMATRNEYTGEIGDRTEFTLTKVRSHFIQGEDYSLVINTFVDAAGRTVVWTTGKNIGENGETVKLRGTIKDHKEYKGTKQTVITRCKVIS